MNDQVHPEYREYDALIESLKTKKEPTIESLQDEIRILKTQVISGFYEDEVPYFRQGYPTHELEEIVTADHVQWMCSELNRLRDLIKDIHIHG